MRQSAHTVRRKQIKNEKFDFTKDSDINITLLVDLNEEEAEQFSNLEFEYNVGRDIWMVPVVNNIQDILQTQTNQDLFRDEGNQE